MVQNLSSRDLTIPILIKLIYGQFMDSNIELWHEYKHLNEINIDQVSFFLIYLMFFLIYLIFVTFIRMVC